LPHFGSQAVVLALRLRQKGSLASFKALSAKPVGLCVIIVGKTLELKRPGRSAKRSNSRPNPKPRRRYK
jgi:hypothetical protein